MPPGTALFARRVLVVTSDRKYFEHVAAVFRDQRYEVVGARDGFEALLVLRGALPDLLVCELSLPHMSGFELLSVVRTRFPQIAVIAASGEYNSATLPQGTIADAFVAKNPNDRFELLMVARDLIAGSPLRATKAKAELAPVWIPRSSTGYVIVTCPACLRSFSVAQPDPTAVGALAETCLACGARIMYQMDSSSANLLERSPELRAEEAHDEASAVKSAAERTIARTKKILNRHKAKR